jgi:transcription-repair coupling factor (superfamily II helicase)
MERLRIFVNNSDLGDDIELAEEDLRVRGCGSLYGTKQKGKGRWGQKNVEKD